MLETYLKEVYISNLDASKLVGTDANKKLVSITQIDHGSLGGLSDDDHTQYTLSNGRSGGQTISGGVNASENLLIRSTSHATRGSVQIADTLEANQDVYVGSLVSNPYAVSGEGEGGCHIVDLGVNGISLQIGRVNGPPAAFGTNTDAQIIGFYAQGVNEGSISVSGTTISYNAFCGAHWSQLIDNSKIDILCGTVMETIDDMCIWPGETNIRLAKVKISDTVNSNAVYGVFMNWDDKVPIEQKDNPAFYQNDMNVASLGAYVIRINSGISVQKGNLLQSNGNGCAKVQDDDIIRSSTIAKVTSNHVVETYPDGSYLVPCVLYCG